MHPLGYFALAPNGTSDAAILKKMVSRYSGYKERLDSEQKLGLGAILSYYLFYKLKYKSKYTVSDALIDAMRLCTKVSIHNLLLTHEGISNDSALGLIKFLTSQRRERAAVLGEAVPKSKTNSRHSQKPAIFDRLNALQKQLQQMGQNHQTELDTQKLQMQADLEAVNRELLSIKTVWLSLYGNGSSNQVETVPGGFQ